MSLAENSTLSMNVTGPDGKNGTPATQSCSLPVHGEKYLIDPLAPFHARPRERMLAEREKDRLAMEEPGYNGAIVRRAQKRMARVDAMPPQLRSLVYEYNLEVIQEFLNHGVKPASIKHLIDTVLGADFKNGQPRFKLNKSPNAKRNPASDEEEYYSATQRRF